MDLFKLFVEALYLFIMLVWRAIVASKVVFSPLMLLMLIEHSSM